jgi:hypothetical protein
MHKKTCHNITEILLKLMTNTNQSTTNKTLVNFIPQPFMFQCRGSKYVVGLGL